jgi:branched-chain amino acid aminotransferase
MQVTITKADQLKTKPDENKLGFGTIFTDHMFNMDYSVEKGWHNPRIEPYAPLVMEPSTMVLHYGQGVFEGMKAYRNGQGGFNCFVPRKTSSASMHPTASSASPKSTKPLPWMRSNSCSPLKRTGYPVHRELRFTSARPSSPPTPSWAYGRLYLSVLHHSQPGGSLLRRRVQPGENHGHQRTCAGGARRRGRHQDPGQLCGQPACRRQGPQGRLHPGAVAGRRRAEIRGRSGRHEHFLRHRRRTDYAPLSGSILPGITRDSVLALGKSWGMTVSEKKNQHR